jgi:hypothetical protein
MPTDTERLDWLEDRPWVRLENGQSPIVQFRDSLSRVMVGGKNLREVIDHAMETTVDQPMPIGKQAIKTSMRRRCPRRS